MEAERQPEVETEPTPGSRLRWLVNLVLLVLLILISVRGPLLKGLGRGLIHEDPPQRADLMVVLSGSPAVRALAAADYYREGQAPRIFVSRGELEQADLVADLDLLETGSWDLTFRILTSRGVPPGAIIRDTVHVNSTWAEAERVKAFVRGGPVKRVLVVTSRYHSQRAHLIFTHLLGPEIKVISRPSRYDPFDPEAWWRDQSQAGRVLQEYEKLIYFYLRRLF